MNISDFAAVFDCTVWEYDGVDRYGAKSYKAPVFLPASIWYTASNQVFTNSNGQEMTAKYEIICPHRPNVTPVATEYMKPLNYIAFGEYASATPDYSVAHMVQSAGPIKVPFDGLDDEWEVMV